MQEEGVLMSDLINNTAFSLMGPKIIVWRTTFHRMQIRFPRSNKSRIVKKWEKKACNWEERVSLPPMKDDEFIMMGNETIMCTPAGESVLKRELGLK